jgi:hypothetical protein
VTDIPTAVWSGSFSVFGVELKCHVLDNGQRIIEADSMADFFNGLADADAVAEDPNLDEFVRWFRS